MKWVSFSIAIKRKAYATWDQAYVCVCVSGSKIKIKRD
jgi:hypothetical protein